MIKWLTDLKITRLLKGVEAKMIPSRKYPEEILKSRSGLINKWQWILKE